MRTGKWLVPGLLVLSASRAMSQPLIARRAPTDVTQTAAVLQVPYVAQSELLCGGAAIAMLERWWGRRGVYAEEFANLVHRDEGGIRTTDMSRATRERGWNTLALSTTAARVQASIADSVPVIALIQVGRNRYHYVVIVGWTATDVTYHDPAESPFVHVPIAAFETRWSGANRWAMFVRPSSVVAGTASAVPTPSAPAAIDSLPCRPWLDQAADAANDKRLTDADSLLGIAARRCPDEPLVSRELAGVRFRQGKYAEAARLAATYAANFRADTLGWRLLASSRFLSRDENGALAAWNAIGRPTIDLVRIDGSQRIRFRTLADGIGVSAGQLLTPARFALAQRRLADIPALASASVSYAAVSGDAVEIRSTVVERPVIEPLTPLLLGIAVRAAVTSQATIVIGSPLRLGELWTAQWRWESADPRVALRTEIPTKLGMPGIVSFERSWETYRWAAGIPEERRSASAVNMRGWLRDDLDAIASARFERWRAQGDFVALGAGGALHVAQDRIALQGEVEHAIPLTHNASYDRIRTRSAWEIPVDRWSNAWSLRLGADWTSANAPRGLWSIAGGDLTRDIPLRAHPFIVDNLLPTSRSGEAIVYGGVASDRQLTTVGPVAIGAGVFVDAANVMSSADSATVARFYLDGGAGLRLGLAGLKTLAVRMDVARGLVTDKRWGVSIGLTQVWPRRLGTAR